MKKVAILGPESTGKSTLAAALAQALNTEWVPEYAREYLGKLDREYVEKDLLMIALGQLANELILEKRVSNWLVCDTEMTVLKIWSENSFGRVNPHLLQYWRMQDYAHYFLTCTDVPWEYDPMREHPHSREYLFAWYQAELNLKGVPYTVVRGSETDRLNHCLEVLRNLNT
ncbi:MAG: ATP-binding protein [Bacteroidota bacterium]